MKNNYPGWANVTFNDNLMGNESLNVSYTLKNAGGDGYVILNDHLNRVSSDYLMWYDVTNLIQPDNNIASVHTDNNNCPSFDGRIIHITLVVAYNDGSGDTIYYYINRGHDVDSYYLPDNYIGSTNFAANIPLDKNIQKADLMVVHRSSTDGTYTFNSGSIPSGTPQGSYGGSNIWDVTDSFIQSDVNTLTYDRVAQFYKMQIGILTAECEGSAAELPDLTVTDINAHHYDIWYPPFLKLSNEVNITVENTGNGAASPSKVSLYADNVFIGKVDVPAIDSSNSATVQMKWTPLGTDCEDGGSPITYSLKAIADCDSELIESDEDNNESITYSETAYWNGYSADEHLTIVLHGTVQGGLYYTTGDGSYVDGGLTSGESEVISFDDIGTSIPGGAEIALARLNVYYCWSHYTTNNTGLNPSMEVSLTNSTGTYVLTSAAKYNDRPCDSTAVGYDYSYGNYVYDVANYLKGESTVTVTITNLLADSMFAPAAPGIVILYEDDTKPEYEYWLVEGADLIQGGRRPGCGYLSQSECICNATFTGSVSTGSVETATLGIISAWGGGSAGFEAFPSYYWFNTNYLGDDSILGGYSSPGYSNTVNDMTMYVGVDGTSAQIGANVCDVTNSIINQDNTVSFGDDGDSMMPANAFLLVSHTSTPGLRLSISATPTTVMVGTPTDVTFTVTNGTTPVEGADITLTGSATGSGTTNSTGNAVISVNATSKGTITATATKEGYTGDTTTLTADEEGEGVSSSVSLSVDIKPAISLEVTPNNIDFGDLSPGETSNAQTLTLKNKGGYDFTVTAQVSDNQTEDTLFKNGLLLNSAAWGEYTAPIVAQASDTADASLNVPNDYTGIGQKQGGIMFWAEA